MAYGRSGGMTSCSASSFSSGMDTEVPPGPEIISKELPSLARRITDPISEVTTDPSGPLNSYGPSKLIPFSVMDAPLAKIFDPSAKMIPIPPGDFMDSMSLAPGGRLSSSVGRRVRVRMEFESTRGLPSVGTIDFVTEVLRERASKSRPETRTRIIPIADIRSKTAKTGRSFFIRIFAERFIESLCVVSDQTHRDCHRCNSLPAGRTSSIGGSRVEFSGSQATLARTMLLELIFPGRKSGLVIRRQAGTV